MTDGPAPGDRRRRVAVTGLGVCCPAGNDLDTFWTTLLAGRSTAGPIVGFDTSEHPVKFACEVREFDPGPYLGTKEAAVEVLAVDPSAVTEEARFKEDLDADSLDLVEFVMALEERFDISVPEEDLDGVDTVGQALTLVLGKLGANA